MTKTIAAAAKPSSTKTTTRRNSSKHLKAPREKAPETAQHSDENDEFVTEVLEEKSSKDNRKTSKNKSAPQTADAPAKPAPKKRNYQPSARDVTVDSYVYSPEGKAKKAAKKDKAVPAKKAKTKESVGKENDSLSKNKGKRTIIKKIRD